MTGAHPHQESVRPLAATIVGLKSPFHWGPPSSKSWSWVAGSPVLRGPPAASNETNKVDHQEPGRQGRPAPAESIAHANGGEGGIRTHGPVARSTVFETAPFDRSGTSPESACRDHGGERGIRTLGRVSPTHAFQACSLSHSDISPDPAKNVTAQGFRRKGRNEAKKPRSSAALSASSTPAVTSSR